MNALDKQRGAELGRADSRLMIWLTVVWLIGYGIFFFSFTLPNSNPATKRTEIWLELPDLLWSNVVTPPNVTSKASWGNLSQRFDLMAVAAAIWLGSWAVGELLLRAIRLPPAIRPTERCVLACGVGISVVSLLTLGCGLLGWMSPWPMASVLGVAFVAVLARRTSRKHDAPASDSIGSDSETSPETDHSLARRASDAKPHRAWRDAIIGVLFRGEQIPYDLMAKSLAVVALTLFLLAMLLGSMLPPTDFDVKAYHLTGPKEYFQSGRITFLEHNVYTNFPFLTEMLCLLGMILRQDWFRGALAGQAVLMGFAPLTALALFCAGRRWFGSGVGWLAATIYLTTPWTYRLAIIAYVEGALCCYLFLTLFAVMLAVEARSVPLFTVAGLLAGSAMACKYPGLVSVVIPLFVASSVGVWLKSDRSSCWRAVLKMAAAFSFGVAITIGPWLLKNLVATGNPVYPLAYGIFGGRDWDAASHAKWRAGHSPKSFPIFSHETDRTLVKYIIDVVAMADWLSPLLFGLAPLALLATQTPKLKIENSKRLIQFLSFYVAYVFFQWWLLTHRIDRFWVPLIPVVALLAGIGCTWSASKIWVRACSAFIGMSVLFNLGFITTPLCGFSGYLSDLNEARRACESTAPGIAYVNALHDAGHLGRNPVVLCVAEAQVFDARMPVIYNTVFDQPIFRDWLATRPPGTEPASEGDWPLRSIDDIRQNFKDAGVTHVLVNWQELLRYRTTYGYSDFVTPARFIWLRQNGLLGPPHPLRVDTALSSYDALDQRNRADFDTWGRDLVRNHEGHPFYLTWQLYPVLPDDHAKGR